MNPNQPLDFYCERLAPGLWAEPVNALSNIAFFIAAYALYKQTVAGKKHVNGNFLWLTALTALVGAGSLAFHTAATVWAHWLDLLFIEAFIYSYIALYLRRVFALSIPKIALGLAAFAVFEWALTGAFEPGALNGSYRYLPALAALAAMTAAAWRYAPHRARPLALATLLFIVAVSLRSLDMALCEMLPMGTHFLWHMLNAVVLYCSAIALRPRGL